MVPQHKGRRNNGLAKVQSALIVAFIGVCIFNLSEAQISPVQQIHFVPKSYFLQSQPSEPVASASELEYSSSSISSPLDITRNPRHLAPDRYYVGPSSSDQSATSTTSLRSSTLDRAGNPIDFNDDLDQELKLSISNNNPNNNQFEAKILPNNPPHHQTAIPRKPSRGKSRRTKTRPPKNVIIYSLPEQSFYAAGNDESSYSEPDSRESTGLRSDVGDEIPEEQQPDVADSKEFRTSSNSAPNGLSHKKALLGQCMAQCIDAILS